MPYSNDLSIINIWGMLPLGSPLGQHNYNIINQHDVYLQQNVASNLLSVGVTDINTIWCDRHQCQFGMTNIMTILG